MAGSLERTLRSEFELSSVLVLTDADCIASAYGVCLFLDLDFGVGVALGLVVGGAVSERGLETRESLRWNP